MKNIKIFVLMLAIVCFAFSGCSNNNSNESLENKDIIEQAAPEDLSSYIVENTEFEDYMSKIDTEIFYSLFNLDEKIVSDAQLYSSTGATAEEVAVIKVTDGNLENVLKACEDRIEAQKQGFENYVPEELEKLSNPLILNFGNTVIFVVCNDNDAVEKLIADYEGI